MKDPLSIPKGRVPEVKIKRLLTLAVATAFTLGTLKAISNIYGVKNEN